MKRNQQDLTSGPLLSGIIAYTVPIILTSVLQLLFNAADLVVVGRFRGSLAVGAVGASNVLSSAKTGMTKSEEKLMIIASNKQRPIICFFIADSPLN